MNEVVKCMLERRSIRRYKDEQITEAELEAILQAALYAPSAGGRQSAIIVVCQNAELNAALGKINRAAFTGRMSTETAYISKEQPSIADSAAIQSGFYNAPTVLTLLRQRIFSIPLPIAALPLKTSCWPLIPSALAPAWLPARRMPSQANWGGGFKKNGALPKNTARAEKRS